MSIFRIELFCSLMYNKNAISLPDIFQMKGAGNMTQNMPACINAIWNILQALSPILLIVLIVQIRKITNQHSANNESIRLVKRDFWYMVIIFSMVLIFILTISFATDGNAFQYFSFTSTLTSIVLSVIAIIMTIVSEQKSDNVKTAIDESVKELQNASKEITLFTEQINEQQAKSEAILSKMDENLSQSKMLLHQVLEKTTNLEQNILNKSKRDLNTDDYTNDDVE